MTVLAVDWSGRRSGEHRFLWRAEAADGELLRLESGRTRRELVDELVNLRLPDSEELVVGLDFSFSLPVWFLDEQGWAGASDLWSAAATDGERWLRECPAPFWGRPGRRRPDGDEQFRVTEGRLGAVGGIRPKSTFQIGGAGSVGTGSVRGFPALARLRAAGFAVWPFDVPARPPVAVEIYPRAFTGVVVKSDAVARSRHLGERYPDLPPPLRDRAIASEDAFDAAVSAIEMSRHEADLRTLPALDDPVVRREGWVWTPDVARRFTPAATPAADG